MDRPERPSFETEKQVISVTNDSKIVNGVQYKQCSRCKRFKSLDEFYKFERGAFGVMSICKECIKQYEDRVGKMSEKSKGISLKGVDITRKVEDWIKQSGYKLSGSTLLVK